jgi:hypothetical protein
MYEKEIGKMKEAAELRHFEAFEHVIKSLMCEIKHDALVKLLVSYIQIFMNDFLIIHPQHKQEYDALSTSDLDQISSNYLEGVIEILEQHRGEPGVNNLRKTTLRLQSLFQLNYCDSVYIETFANSTTNLLIAIDHQTWGVTHRDLYNRWLHGTSNEDLSILATHYNREPEQIQKTKLLLHQFANDFGGLLQSDRQ